MSLERVRIKARPELREPRMILGLSGWMDGGDVSTGTIDYLAERLDAKPLAEIDSADFYIYSFPGTMEVSALFRPNVKIEEGVVSSFDPPTNSFYYDEKSGLVLAKGKEPNFRWSEYADAIFSVAQMVGVSRIYFVGSVGGLVPHTRDPRLFGAVSRPDLKETLASQGVKFTNYEGPGSIVSYLLSVSESKGMEFITLVAEIPPYVQGRNVKCIEAVVRRLSAIFGFAIKLDDLRTLSDELEKRLNEIVEEKEDLADHIRNLEEDYDNEVFNTQMGDLKEWLERQGIRLD